MAWDNGFRRCDRCGCLLTKENNKRGYEICDKCDEILERQVKDENQKAFAVMDGEVKKIIKICK